MRPNPITTYAQQRCAYTAHLRRRCQRAEAEAAVLRAELAAERAAARAERDALTAHVEGPEWTRDFLVMARDAVRGELLELAETHRACKTCGGFGRGLSEGLLQGGIDALTQAHGLPREPALPTPDWPVHMRFDTRNGRFKDGRWLEPPEPKSVDGGGAGGAPWRPPHWREAPSTGLSDGW